MSRIYKDPNLGHIDLDKIVRITDACVDDCRGSGGIYVMFRLDVQLRDAPITYSRAIDGDEDDYLDAGYQVRLTDGSLFPLSEYEEIPPNLLALSRLQSEIDDLIDAWKNMA